MIGSWRARALLDLMDYFGDKKVSGPAEAIAFGMHASSGRPYTGADVRFLLAHVRRREFIDKYGWTIPYVGQGNQAAEYEFVDLSGDRVATRKGLRARSCDMEKLLDRVHAQTEVFVAQTDGRTFVGRRARLIEKQAAAIHSSIELLVEELSTNGSV